MFDLLQRWHRALGESIVGGGSRKSALALLGGHTPPKEPARFRRYKHILLILLVDSPKLNFRFHPFYALG
jgi:hypothetical protein